MGYGHTPSLITKCLHYAMSVSLIIALLSNQSVYIATNMVQCNSSSNRSPYRIQYNSSSNRSPYRIQCNSSSNRPPIGYSVIVALTDPL